MEYHYFSIAVNAPEQQALNQLLNERRVSSVQQEFVANGDNSFWAVSVAVLGRQNPADSPRAPKRPSIDYREVLSPEDFSCFAVLRELRKSVAQSEGKPVYAIFNNEQLAALAQMAAPTLADLAGIEGVGEKRVAAYGELFINTISQARASQS